MALLGIDVGSQSLKAVVVDADLRVLGTGSSAYRPSYPRPGWAEQDPRLWLAALQPAIGAALAASGMVPKDIGALAVCGQLDGCVPVDADGAPLHAALIWMDRRGVSHLAGIDPGLIRDRCGLVSDATHMAAKIAWLASGHPSAPVATWHQPVSFIVAALTGERVMSHSLASTTMLYDVRRRDWAEDLLDRFGATPAQMPALADEAAIAGRLTRAGAELTGLPTGLTMAVGTGDDFSNMLGCGIARPGVVGVSLGTAETVAALSSRELVDPDMLVETHRFPGGQFHLGNPGWLSGGAVRWAASLLSTPGDAAFAELAATAPPGCDGLVFMPALSGAMAPRWIASARGSFIGLSSAHGPAHLARAVLEGTAFAMRDVVDRLDALGVATDRLRLMGGGAQSALWCQIRADLTGRPADVLDAGDASVLGAAMLAAIAAGRASDIASASALLDVPTRQVQPGPPVYEAAYRRYREAFDLLEPFWQADTL